jgi:hypothetical protein
MPKARPVAGLFFSGRPFLFGDFFFGGQQRKSHSAAAVDEDRRYAE